MYFFLRDRPRAETTRQNMKFSEQKYGVVRHGYSVEAIKALILFLFRRHETAQDKARDADDKRTPEGGLEPLYAKADMHAFGKP